MVIVNKHPRLEKRPRLKTSPVPIFQKASADSTGSQKHPNLQEPNPTGSDQLTQTSDNKN